MRISSVETFVLKIDTSVPYLGAFPGSATAGNDERATQPSATQPTGYTVRKPWRSIYSPLYETLLVAITAEDGTVGWGEALAPVGPEVPAAVVDRLLAPVLRGADALAPRPMWSALRDLMRERGHLGGHQADALAAVDIALWDLAGRLTGRSVAELLGGAFRTDIPTYVSGLPRPSDGERAALAKEWEERGTRAVKLHLGNGVDADLATVAAIRAAAPSLRIAVDAHWVYSVSEAIALTRGLAEQRGWFLEAPVAPEDLAGHAALAARSDVPIAVGEALRHRYEFSDWLDQRAMGIAQPDVARTGITEAMIIAELAAARHVPVAPHHSVCLNVALAAGLHVSAAVENFAVFEYQPTSVEVGARVLREPLEPRADGFALPDGPGLGIEVDLEAVRQLRH